MLFEKVKNIIAEQLDADVEEITMETSMMKDLNADSLDAVEIMMALEDEFGIEISDEDAEHILTLGQVVDYVSNKIN